MNGIGWAVKQMENGAKVSRAGWNGKGMFLFLVAGSTFKVNRAPLLGIYPEGTEVNYLPHVDMKTATGEVVPWLASQTDLLAKDWGVVGEEIVSRAPAPGIPIPLIPIYTCHKKVRALKIEYVGKAEDGTVSMTFVGRPGESATFTPSELKNRPAPEAGMYMIVYPDLYVSFSPAKQFEEGYTLLES